MDHRLIISVTPHENTLKKPDKVCVAKTTRWDGSARCRRSMWLPARRRAPFITDQLRSRRQRCLLYISAFDKPDGMGYNVVIVQRVSCLEVVSDITNYSMIINFHTGAAPFSYSSISICAEFSLLTMPLCYETKVR